MHQVKHHISGKNNNHDFRADRPMLTQPKVIGKTKIGGVIHYMGENGRLFRQDLFDKFFRVKKTAIKKAGVKENGGLILNQW